MESNKSETTQSKPTERDGDTNRLRPHVVARYATVGTFLIVAAQVSNEDTENPILFLAPCLVFVGVIVFLILQNVLPELWVRAAIRSGDYDAAVRRAQWLSRLQPKRIQVLSLEGTTLMQAQRYDEAIALFDKTLSEGRHQVPTGFEAIMLHQKCVALTELGRHTEAKTAFEGLIQIRPEATLAYADFAELYLGQGLEPQHMLKMVERALSSRQSKPLISRLDGREIDCELWSMKAWALALTGDHEAAKLALDEAFRVADRGHRPAMATLNYRAAMVAKLRGDAAAAAEYLKTAVDLDPNGAAGKLARAAL